MICSQCGTNTQANTGFCPNCGATIKAGGDGAWNGTTISPGTPPAAAPAATNSTLQAVCNRRSALRNSVPWIVGLAACVTIGMAFQLYSRQELAAFARTQEQLAAANSAQGASSTPASPTVPAAPVTPAENALSRLTKITDVGEFVRQIEVADALRSALGSDLEEFQRNLGVSGLPVLAGETITFTACAPQACGTAEAAVSVATDTATLTAAILANHHIRIYGAKSNKLEDCPAALQAWVNKLAQGTSGEFTYEMRPGQPAGTASAEPARN
jgi:hypothetical protein